MYARRDSLYGILNGIDYDEYNPMTDQYIAKHFDVTNIKEGKKANKLALQKESSLPQKEDALLIGMVSRLTDQKGFDLVAYMMDEILSTMNVQFVVLGTGENRYENMFHHFQGKYPDKISSYIGYSEDRAHRIYAGCDVFLMPSLFEPCGLSQLMSMRYGTLPIVRETGGLKDTVKAYNDVENTGNGFSFKQYTAHEMLYALQYANKIYCNNKKAWLEMQKRAMKEDFSWDSSAREYEELYNSL